MCRVVVSGQRRGAHTGEAPARPVDEVHGPVGSASIAGRMRGAAPPGPGPATAWAARRRTARPSARRARSAPSCITVCQPHRRRARARGAGGTRPASGHPSGLPQRARRQPTRGDPTAGLRLVVGEGGVGRDDDVARRRRALEPREHLDRHRVCQRPTSIVAVGVARRFRIHWGSEGAPPRRRRRSREPSRGVRHRHRAELAGLRPGAVRSRSGSRPWPCHRDARRYVGTSTPPPLCCRPATCGPAIAPMVIPHSVPGPPTVRVEHCRERACQPFAALVDDPSRLADGPLDRAGLAHLDPAGRADARLDLVLERARDPARLAPASAGGGSTRTVSSTIRPGWVSTHWKYGDSRGSASTCSSICVGKTLTPRTIIMSSVRPVILSIRRIDGRSGARQQPGEVPGAVTDHRHRLLRQRGEDELADLAVGQDLPGHRVDDLRVEVVLPDVQPVLRRRRLLRDAGPITSDRP